MTMSRALGVPPRRIAATRGQLPSGLGPSLITRRSRMSNHQTSLPRRTVRRACKYGHHRAIHRDMRRTVINGVIAHQVMIDQATEYGPGTIRKGCGRARTAASFPGRDGGTTVGQRPGSCCAAAPLPAPDPGGCRCLPVGVGCGWLAQVVPVTVPGGGCSSRTPPSCGTSRRGTSYVAAVERAISAAGHVIVDMADFPAADQASRAGVRRAGARVRRVRGGAGHPVRLPGAGQARGVVYGAGVRHRDRGGPGPAGVPAGHRR